MRRGLREILDDIAGYIILGAQLVHEGVRRMVINLIGNHLRVYGHRRLFQKSFDHLHRNLVLRRHQARRRSERRRGILRGGDGAGNHVLNDGGI